MLVLPVPGGPYNRMCGTLRVLSMPLKDLTASSWETISDRLWGRLVRDYYFSIQGLNCSKGFADCVVFGPEKKLFRFCSVFWSGSGLLWVVGWLEPR